MANRLVPYIQDVNQWTNYYIQRARNQKHPGDMMKEVKIVQYNSKFDSTTSSISCSSQIRSC